MPQDDGEAVKWFRREQGNADAQTNLGTMYARGLGVPLAHDEAVKWLGRAAEQGQALAQMKLGMACASGKGVSAPLLRRGARQARSPLTT